MKHLTYRQFWLRDLNASGAYQARINNMVANWDAMGIVAEQPAARGPDGPAGLAAAATGWRPGAPRSYAEPDPDLASR